MALKIIEKVQAITENMLSECVYSRNPFGLSNNSGISNSFDGAVKIFGSKGISYIPPQNIVVNSDLLTSYKVIMSKTSAEHAGQADKEGRKRILSRIEVLGPNEICSESYLLVKICQDEKEAKNVVAYLKTRFVRFLLSTILLTQNIAKDKFAYIPVLDFTSNNDINWCKSTLEIDQQLYLKYHLTDEEIAFIEKMIKPM